MSDTPQNGPIEDLIPPFTPLYNRYLPSDFTPGTDNLNPKRPITAEDNSAQQISQVQAILFLTYQNTLAKLAALGDNAQGLPPGAVGIPYSQRTQVQGTADLGNRTPFSNIPPDPSIPLAYNLGVLSVVTGGVITSSSGILTIIPQEDLTIDALKQAALRELPYDFCSTYSGITNNGINSFAQASNSNLSSDQQALVTALTSALDGLPNVAQLSGNSSPAACLALELQWLKMILWLLGLLQQVMQLERTVLAIIWPIINIATMIANIWNNPSEIGRIARYLVGIAQAIITGALTQAIETLIDSWGLDCLLQGTLEAVQQILGTLTGVSDIGASIGAFVQFNENLNNSLTSSLQIITSSFTNRMNQLDAEGKNPITEMLGAFTSAAFGQVQVVGQQYLKDAEAPVTTAKVVAAQIDNGVKNLEKNVAQLSSDGAANVITTRMTNVTVY